MIEGYSEEFSKFAESIPIENLIGQTKEQAITEPDILGSKQFGFVAMVFGGATAEILLRRSPSYFKSTLGI